MGNIVLGVLDQLDQFLGFLDQHGGGQISQEVSGWGGECIGG